MVFVKVIVDAVAEVFAVDTHVQRDQLAGTTQEFLQLLNYQEI